MEVIKGHRFYTYGGTSLCSLSLLILSTKKKHTCAFADGHVGHTRPHAHAHTDKRTPWRVTPLIRGATWSLPGFLTSYAGGFL